MNNYRILTLVNLLAFVAIGISSPLLTLYLQALGADFALISVILTSVVVVALIAIFLLGRLADRLGRRKPLYIAGLLGVTLAYFWLSRAGSEEFAWAARLLDGASMAAVSTLGLTLMGDTLDTSNRRGAAWAFSAGWDRSPSPPARSWADAWPTPSRCPLPFSSVLASLRPRRWWHCCSMK